MRGITASRAVPRATPGRCPDEASGAPACDCGASLTRTGARDSQLSAERNLLEVAHTALSQRDAACALASLESHATQFPNEAELELSKGFQHHQVLERLPAVQPVVDLGFNVFEPSLAQAAAAHQRFVNKERDRS
jgi:hypothetical protein